MNYVKRLSHLLLNSALSFQKALRVTVEKLSSLTIKTRIIQTVRKAKRVLSVSLLYVPFSMSILVLLAIVTAAPINSLQTGKPEKSTAAEGYLVSIEDRDLGYVRDRDAFRELTRNMDQQYYWITQDSLFWNLVRFQHITLENPPLFTGSIQERLKAFLEEYVKGWRIRVDDNDVVTVDSKEKALSVIKTVLEEYTPKAEGDNSIAIMELGIVEHVEIFPAVVPKETIRNEPDALHYIKKGTYERKSYTVVADDTIWDIGRKFGLSMAEIQEANPDIKIDRIYPGDTINLIVPKPFITVRAEFRHTYHQAIPYTIHIIWDDTLYRTELKQVRAGKNGTEEITAQVTTVNGKIVSEDVMNKRTLQSPQTGVIRRGTQRTPDDILVSSSFLPPGEGLISSFFGPRWGAFHYGIDVAVPIGTPVHTFESGRVVFSGLYGRFGQTVIIEHTGGMTSTYGHLSTILVSNDQKVAKGTHIAYSGNSGFSTGPHVHFEIRQNNRPVDPLDYLQSVR